jgi:uncharacterized protein YegL
MAADGKIQCLNTAIRESLPLIRKVADKNPYCSIRVLKFSSGAEWINKDPIPLENFSWSDLDTSSTDRDIGSALSMVAEEMKILPMSQRSLPPVLILIASGSPTDDFNKGLKKLLDEPWGKRAVRIGIGIGSDAEIDVLQKFINNPEIKPYFAHNAQDLIKFIRWIFGALTQRCIPPSEEILMLSLLLDDVSKEIW